MSSRQLLVRRWLTLWVLPALAGLAIPVSLFAASAAPTAMGFGLSCGVVAAGLVRRFVVPALPAVWEPPSDQQMLQLLTIAQEHVQAAELVLQINVMRRDFAVQDWHQARAIELEAGERSLAAQAEVAARKLRSMSAQRA